MSFRTVKLSIFTRLCIPLLLSPVFACSGSETEVLSPAAPSPAASTPRGTFTFHGQVIEGRSRLPISEATVSVAAGLDAGRSATTDASGQFRFTDMQESSLKAWVSAEDHFGTSSLLESGRMQTVFLQWLGPAIQFSGRVTDAITSVPIGGATVYVNGRYKGMSDASGNYSLTGRLDIGDSSIVWTSTDGYESHTRYIRGNSAQSFRLRPIERIVAGQSWSVTVNPDDSLCNSDFYDPSFGVPGTGFVCRTVRVVAVSNGLLQIEAVSTADGSHPPLEVIALGNSPCCNRGENPISINVRTGTELIVMVVGMPELSSTSQSFIVTTSMSP